ncbi:MAG: crossover junction endonuclease [Promethearchaeota archaeon]|jgi:crossover junction endonuclease MUS81
MDIKLILDTRENALHKLLPNAIIKSLDIGDILFELNGEPVVIIERKSVSDLASSIYDGRAREQKARLLNSGVSREKIMFLIEGDLNKNIDEKVGCIKTNTLLGSIINTIFRDGVKVYKTACVQETAIFIDKLLCKLIKDYKDFYKYSNTTEGITECEYSATLKTSKKANMTPNVWFITQLSLVPQVTNKLASVIVEKYPTLFELVKAYEETDKKLELLSSLTYSVANNKTRKIGPKISERVYKFVYGID